MKCPEGTVEVAVWADGIYFDKEHRVEDQDAILEIVNNEYASSNDRLLYNKIFAALKPITDLSGPSWRPHNNEVFLFTPEEFETLTEGVEYEMPERNQEE